MDIQLTCACGRRQPVPIALAGTSTRCAGCGQLLAVPALGIAVPRGQRLRADRGRDAIPAMLHPLPRRRVPAMALFLLGGGALLLLLVALGLWQLATPRSNLAARLEPRPAVFTADLTPAPPAPAPVPAPPVPAPPVPAPPAEPPVNKPLKPAPPRVVKPLPAVLDRPPALVKPLPPRAQPPARPVVLPKRPFQQGDTFLQDLVVTQKSRLVVQGLPVATFLQYRVVSRYTVRKARPDGTLTVTQKVESAMLRQADELTRGLLAGPVAQLPGTVFTLEISPRGEVTKFGGAGGAPAAARLPGGLGVQLASLLDADGWKELAQATFYQPEDRTQAGRWTRPLTHQWGPLGSWAGQATYAYPDPGQAAQVKVPYTLKLAYQPPKRQDMPGALPFQVAASNFQPLTAGGTLFFDTQRGKTMQAEERFQVRGALVLLLLGQQTPTVLEEEQRFQLRLLAK